jgi:hypothetical protein
MSNQQTVTGACFCGAIGYSIAYKDHPIVNCHCTMCRRTSGAAYVTWAIIENDDFSFSRGNPKTLASSDHGTRTFCDQCGTPLTCVSTRHPDKIDITVGSFDAPAAFVPTQEYYTDTKLSWTDHVAELPQNE